MKQKNILLYTLISIFILILFVPGINRPFFGHHDFNSVFYGQIAKNYLRYGLIQTKGAQVFSEGSIAQDDWQIHTHHPATYPIILSLAFYFFGIHEWVARLVSTIASIIAVIFLAKAFSNKLAVLPLLFTPLFLYYGRFPVFEPVILASIAVTLFTYSKKNYRIFFLSAFIGILIDWPGYWPVIWILIFEMLSRNRDWKIIKASLASIILGTFLILLHQFIITGTFLKSLFEIGDYRLSLNGQPYSNYLWVKVLIDRAKALLGLPLLISSMLGFIISIKEKINLKLALLTLLIAVSHVLVFRNITWYHDYMLYYSIPFVVLTTSIFINYLAKKINFLNQFIIVSILVISTYLNTNMFYTALANLPECKNVKNNLTAETKENNCERFRIFYTDKLK